MESDSGYLIVCIGIVLIVLFNVGLIYSLTSPATREQLRLLTKLAHNARTPLNPQNDQYSELRNRVSELAASDSDAEEEPDDG
jgi:hypothetical protein